MGNRRRARELAMQALFYMDLNPGNVSDSIKAFVDGFSPPAKALPFFYELVKGVMAFRQKIDSVIERFSNNWRIHRMPCVDRNILRVAAFELLYCEDIPVKVSINEAIDIGKKFGSHESGPFINGILDTMRIALEKGEIRMPEENETDLMERRCPRLGGSVFFKYCRTVGDEGLPCFKIMDCWWERFDIQNYLKNNYSEASIERFLNTRPPSKVVSLIELIEKAKKSQGPSANG